MSQSTAGSRSCLSQKYNRKWKNTTLRSTATSSWFW